MLFSYYNFHRKFHHFTLNYHHSDRFDLQDRIFRGHDRRPEILNFVKTLKAHLRDEVSPLPSR